METPIPQYPVPTEPVDGYDDHRPPNVEVKRASLGLKVHVTTPGDDHVFHGTLEHFVAGEASVLLDCRFLKDTPVHVAFQGFRFEGEVLFCERKGEYFDTHIVIPDTDEAGMRRDPRYVVRLPARLHPPQGGAPVEATIVDISREGLGFESPLKLDVGETVALGSQANFAFGIVRHCRALGNGSYLAGLYVYTALSRDEPPAPEPEKKSRILSHLPALW